MNEVHAQELDRIMKLWANAYNTPLVPDFAELAGCNHQVQHYIGFREEYEFCVKCDAKKMNGVWIERPTELKN